MNWIETTVGEYCPFVYGKALPKAKRVNGTAPVYGSNGVVDFHSESHVKQHGVIIGRKGTCGAVNFSDGDFWPIDTTFYVTKDSLDETRFVYYLLSSLGMENMNSDSAVPGLNRDNAHSLRIVIPEQKDDRERLGAYLALFDEKIELNTRMNQTLEKIAQRIFKSWFIDFDPVKANAEGVPFTGLSSDTQSLFPSEFVESKMGLIPKGWEMREICELGEVITGKTPSTKKPEYYGKDIPFITIPDMHRSIFVTQANKYLSEVGRMSQPKKDIPKGSIMVSCIATPGLVSLAHETCHTNQQINSLIPEKSFQYFYLNSLQAISTKNAFSKGGTVFDNMNKSDFSAIPVLVANDVVLQTFEKTVEHLYNRILHNKKNSDALSKVRDKLLPKLLSGSIEIEKENKAA